MKFSIILFAQFWLIIPATYQIFQNQNIGLQHFQQLLSEKNVNITQLRSLITDYAFQNFYGDWNTSDSLMSAVFFFRVASDLGDPAAKFYSSMLHYFELDGTYSVKEKLLNETLDEVISRHKNDLQILKKYIKVRNQKLSFTNAYFAALDGNDKAILNLGFRYSNGLNSKINCSSGSLYYLNLAKASFLESENEEDFVPKYLERKRLDSLIFYNQDFDALTDFTLTQDHYELELIKMNADSGKTPYIIKLAYSYYYGLKGLPRDFNKTFELLSFAAYLGDVSAKSSLGYLYVKGIGTEKNYQKAYNLFMEGATKLDPRSLNGLGYMYMNGYHVEKDLHQAFNYFKSSADKGNPDGLFNYASLMLLPGEFENTKKAHDHLSMAAHQGHAEAMYQLALMHLDGTDTYSSCLLSNKLLRSVIERGKFGTYLETGYNLFQSGMIKEALLQYFEAAYLGYDIGVLNAAIILDKYPILNYFSTDFHDFREFILKNEVFQLLAKENIIQSSMDPIYYMFKDCIDLISVKEEKSKIIIFERLLLNVPGSNQYSKKIAYDLYNISASIFGDNFASLRMGDYYYYGWVISPNHALAYKHYKKATQHQINNSFVANAYFNLGVMSFMGEGTEKNASQAIDFLEAAANISDKFAFLSNPLIYLLRYENETGIRVLGGNISYVDVFTNLIYGNQAEVKSGKYILIILGITGILLHILRVRIRNYNEIFSQRTQN